MMFTASDYRKYASECVEAARKSKSDQRREHYLDMARMWTVAAARLNGGDMLPQLAEETAR
jgi:hypothetical protein